MNNERKDNEILRLLNENLVAIRKTLLSGDITDTHAKKIGIGRTVLSLSLNGNCKSIDTAIKIQKYYQKLNAKRLKAAQLQ